jgi:peptidoglycan/LPS O-acetylase OafA/YrhL
VLSAGWVALIAYNFLYPWYSGLLLYTRVAEFFMGVLGAYIVCGSRGRRISGAWPLGAAVLLCAVFYLDTYGHMPHYWDVLNYGPICALLISTGALWDLWRHPRYPRWIMVLGDASCAIYLLHYVERDALHYVIVNYVFPVPALAAHVDTLIVLGIATIAFTGVLFHWWIERPTVRWLHAMLG